MRSAREAWLAAAKRLSEANIESARLDARVLLAAALDVAPEDIVSCGAPSPAQVENYEGYVSRRVAREPLAYIVGRKEFMSLPFAVGPGVLVPRPETETLLEEAFRAFPDRGQALNVLDLGTGSGCLLIAFLRNYPRACGLGVDHSSTALTWAKSNAERLGVAMRSEWREGDWASALPGTYDVIFSNPPYLRIDEEAGLEPEIACHEPSAALFAGTDGLDAYRALAPIIASGLKAEGLALLEIGHGQRGPVGEILARQDLEIVSVKPDLAGTARCIAARRATGFSAAAAEKTVGNLRSSR